MKHELLRCLRSHYFLVGIVVIVIMFAGGYAIEMPSHPNGVDLMGWIAGIYLFYTQFGALFFSAYAISSICKDYSEKLVLYYHESGFSSVAYFVARIVALATPLILGTVIGFGVACAAFHDLSPWPVMVVHCLCVMVFYVAFSAFLALMLKTFVSAYFTGVAIWVFATFLSTNYPSLWLLGFFDQNSPVFLALLQNLQNPDSFAVNEVSQLAGCVLYAATMIALLVIASGFIQRRWIANGV